MGINTHSTRALFIFMEHRFQSKSCIMSTMIVGPLTQRIRHGSSTDHWRVLDRNNLFVVVLSSDKRAKLIQEFFYLVYLRVIVNQLTQITVKCQMPKLYK